MKKVFLILLAVATLLPATSKPIQFTLGNWLWKPASDQALLTTSSPTFAGLTLSGGTASTLAYLNASKAFTSLANSAGYLLNDGSGGLSWAAALKPDGTTPLTADWNVGAFDLTCVDMNATNGLFTGRIGATRGAAGTPSIYDLADTDTGIYFANDATYPVKISYGGADIFRIGPSYFRFSANLNTLYFPSAETWQLNGDAVSPVDQFIKTGNGSGTDKAGAMFTMQGGASTGTGAGGSVRLQTSTVAATGSTANTYYTRQHVVGKVYSLVDNTATDIFSIACADGNGLGGKIDYTVEVTDGTDLHVESGTVHFAGVNKATETWTSSVAEVSTQAISNSGGGGSLATTWAVDTATADTFKITLNSNSSLTPTSTLLRYQITLNSPRVITIL